MKTSKSNHCPKAKKSTSRTFGRYQKAISKVSNNKKLDLVLNSSETQLGVFYASSNLDITQRCDCLLNSLKKKIIYIGIQGALIIHELFLGTGFCFKGIPD